VASTATRTRVVDAALACLAQDGLRRTTVDDIAVAAGISRATLYRAFPGGRETILATVVDDETDRLLGAVGAAVGAAEGLRDALVAGLVAAAAFVTGHRAIERLMFDEPATLLTHLEFEQFDRVLATLSRRAAPLLARFLGATAAERAAEFATRVAVSYLLLPSDEVDLTEPAAVGWLVDTFVLPGVAAAATGGETISTKLS
jgi:AcrR family transcriptional regulator